MKVFVTGGAGFIGSHACVDLLQANHDVLVYDNLSNSSRKSMNCVKLITNRSLEFVEGDIRDGNLLSKAIADFNPDAVIHFAGLKAVGDSVLDPLSYYEINVQGSVELLKAMNKVRCNVIIFSSSATVYGEAEYLPYDEKHVLNPINPYGQTKWIIEKLLHDWVNSNNHNRAICLRYFNPVGAHESGLIGERPNGTPNNLMPFIAQVAAGQRDELFIFGDDFPTRDGSGERDFVHVSDLSMAHLKALEKIEKLERFEIFNVGSGRGTTVFELIKAFEIAAGVKIKKKVVSRRVGDTARSWADTSRAKKLLNLQSYKTIQRMCEDTWRWQTMNPNGYDLK